jgi:hypothetical protein
MGRENSVLSIPAKTERASFLPSRNTGEQLPDGMSARSFWALMGNISVFL